MTRTINTVRCPNGHVYDPSKYSQCPYCNPATQNVYWTIDGTQITQPSGSFGTVGATAEKRDSVDATVPGGSAPWVDVDITHPANPEKDNAWGTVPIEPVSASERLIVGWLVSIHGPAKGKDYRIRFGNNAIGRSKGDIVIAEDGAISRESMAYVIFDARTNQFLLSAGTGINVIYLNHELVPIGQSRELKPYDRIEMGETVLLFQPLCGESFNWQNPLDDANK